MITLLVLVVVLVSLALSAYQLQDTAVRRSYANVVGAIRWWMVPAALVGIAGFLAVWLGLAHISWMRWSWWYALGGSGNASLGQTSGAETSDALRSVETVLGFVIPVFVILLVPALARAEEVLFRQGTEYDGPIRVLGRSLAFGLVHATVGVPLGAAVALTVPGAMFHLVYRAAAPTGLPSPRPRPIQPSVHDLFPAAGLVATATGAIGTSALESAKQRLALLEHHLDETRRWEELGAIRTEGREKAVDRAAALHAVYNWIALAIFVVFVWIL